MLEWFASKKEKKFAKYYFTQVDWKPIFNLRRCCNYFTQVLELTYDCFTHLPVCLLRIQLFAPVF